MKFSITSRIVKRRRPGWEWRLYSEGTVIALNVLCIIDPGRRRRFIQNRKDGLACALVASKLILLLLITLLEITFFFMLSYHCISRGQFTIPIPFFHILGIVKENEPPARSDEYWNFENNCRLIIDTRACISLNLKRYRLKALFIVYTSANLKGWNGNDAGAGTISPLLFFCQWLSVYHKLQFICNIG